VQWQLNKHIKESHKHIQPIVHKPMPTTAAIATDLTTLWRPSAVKRKLSSTTQLKSKLSSDLGSKLANYGFEEVIKYVITSCKPTQSQDSIPESFVGTDESKPSDDVKSEESEQLFTLDMVCCQSKQLNNQLFAKCIETLEAFIEIKMSMTLLVVSSVTCETSNSSSHDEWNYNDQSKWDLHFKACGGKHESPINIDTRKVLIDSNLKICFHNYDHVFHKIIAQNNGHTVRVFLRQNYENEEMPYISGTAVSDRKYILDSFHFHWGLDEEMGSEHSINNIFRSAENYSNATDKADGLVVVTVFVECKVLTDFDLMNAMEDNSVVTPIIKALPHIREFS
ncbi:unnamed protein product, partial [Medioppia subpectinata]